MKKGLNNNNTISKSILIIFIGIFICFIGLASAKFDITKFYENGDHVWYRTVKLDNPFIFGIGEWYFYENCYWWIII